MHDRRWWSTGAAVALAAVLIGCGGGGGNSTPTAPTPAPTPAPNPPPTGGGGTGGGGANPTAATITITAAGVSPREVTVAPGGRVTFVNNDSQPHDMSSDPHPEHTGCPDVTVGFLSAGQSRTTQNLNTVRSCGFHDHNQPSVANLQGVIRIQ